MIDMSLFQPTDEVVDCFFHDLWVICFFYHLPREPLHLHSCLHEFRFSFGSSISHIPCEVLGNELPRHSELILYPSTHLCFWFCREFVIVVVKVFLIFTRDHPRCGTWMFEIWTTIQCGEFIFTEECELHDHDISGFWFWEMRISFIVESCRGDLRIWEYRTVVFRHFEGTVVRWPEASGEHDLGIIA